MARKVVPLATIASVLGLVLVVAGPSVAATSCSVKNERTGATRRALQPAVDRAAKGDTLQIRGTCIGNTAIRGKVLHLEGIPTGLHPIPTLDAQDGSRVLYVKGSRVAIRDLTISNGRAEWGGGILVDRGGRVTLNGTATLSSNRAHLGAGAFVRYDGTLTMNDSSAVTANVAKYHGGGIYILAYNEGGRFAMHDTSSVYDNRARISGGGGIYNEGTVRLDGASSVTGNSAGHGGGIANDRLLVLDGSASVTGNTALTEGGGVIRLGPFDVLRVCSELVALSPNDPDDPPQTEPCP